MKTVLSFYADLLLKLSLTQSILITTFTSWIQCLWGGVSCCQHIPPSVTGSSASLVTACWEKLLPLLPWCSVSNPPLFLVSFRALFLRYPQRRSIATRDTRSDEYWSADEISSESRQNRSFWNTSPQQSPMIYRPALQGNWNALFSLEERSRTNSPRQRFHSQLFCKIVRYFRRTLS
jgi:hypothetical protein